MTGYPAWIDALPDRPERGREPYRRPGSHLLLTDEQWAAWDALQALRARQRARGRGAAWVGGGPGLVTRGRALL